jgi:cobalt-zinc-cadmium efflux system membrane fusion protein
MTPISLLDQAKRAAPARADAAPVSKAPPATIWKRVASALPTIGVFAALGASAWFGHHNGWKLPAWGEQGGAASAALWCEAHSVPEDACIECDAKLWPAAKNYGWCQTHGVAECPFEHPEVAQVRQPVVATAAVLGRASKALELRLRPENSSRCQTHLRRIQFASLEALEKAGVGLDVAFERPVVEAVAATGEVQFDETRMAHLSSRVAGTVWQVRKQVGATVEAGEVLALIDAAAVGRLKSELLQALASVRLRAATADRLRPLAASGAVPGQQVRQAEAELQESQIKLIAAQQALANLGLPVAVGELLHLEPEEAASRIKFLGLPPGLAAELAGSAPTSNLYPLRAPLAGTISQRHVVPGEGVDPSSTLFSTVDPSQVWLLLDIRQEDAGLVSLGQKVLFRPHDAGEGKELEGTVNWISGAADPRTRTVEVRAELPNADGRLRARTFGAGRIVLREEAKAVTVPAAALHWDGCCHVVFVRDKQFRDPKSPKFFHVRKVRPGVRQGDQVEVIAGLVPGELVAANNSGLLAAQLLKSNLGAGCGCAH